MADNKTDNGYKCFYKRYNPIEVYSDTSYHAQLQAAKVWNLKPSQRKDVTVVLCERADGSEVIHTAVD
jgi:hypothetical protein